LALCGSAKAADFYVDPDWAGAQSGTEAEPWTDLDASWGTINTALASGPITVYYSAREASADTNQATTTNIDLLRTDGTSNRLTIDGISKYNTNDSTPSWAAYSGSSKCQITVSSDSPITTANSNTGDLTARDNITIRGFYCISNNGGQALFLKSARNCIVENCYFTHGAGSTVGPGVMVNLDDGNVYADAANSTCDNLIFRNNVIEDNYGEGIYISGPKEKVNSHGAGHNGILIENNTFNRTGSRGGQGDSIDVKTYVQNCIVRGNTITDAYVNAIASHSAIIIERNLILDNGIGGGNPDCIRMNNGANATFDYARVDSPALDGGAIRNNVIIRSADTAIDIRSETNTVSPPTYHLRNVDVSNNTIYDWQNNSGIDTSANVTGVTVTNNLISTGPNYCINLESGTWTSHDYNHFYQGGTVLIRINGTNYNISTYAGQEPNSQDGDPLFTAVISDDLSLTGSSPAIGQGLDLSSQGFSNDFLGNARAATWDIGAFEFATASGIGIVSGDATITGTLTVGQ